MTERGLEEGKAKEIFFVVVVIHCSKTRQHLIFCGLVVECHE